MVVRVGSYYKVPFRGETGMTQGDPLSPTIFNVVVDTVVLHWESLVAGITGGGSSNGNGVGQMKEGQIIQGSDDGQRWSEEENVRLKVQAEFFTQTAGWYPPPTWGGSRLHLTF